MSDNTQQYLRDCKLIVSTAARNGLDLSELHIKFNVKRSDSMTPNSAEIRVYNLAAETALQIRKEFTKVLLQGGYEANFGVIFQGNIKQVLIGRESATDTYIDIIAGDGDNAYNFAVVNTTVAKGSTLADQINQAMIPMQARDVGPGQVSVDQTQVLPRGKVMYGNSREYLRNAALSTQSNWSIQDGKINFIKLKTYLPGEAVVLTSKTGMIGAPQQTNEGINIKCLMNPFLRISGRVKVDNASIELFKINLTVPGSPANTPPPLNADGVYYILVVEHVGDNRGQDWYSNLICLSIDITTNPLNSVQIGYGP